MASRTAYISVFDKTTGLPASVPVENYLGVYSARNDVSEGTLQVDATTYIQARIDDAYASVGANTSGGVVLLPNGLYRASTLYLREGVELVGGGSGTEIRQLSGVTGPLITNHPSIGPTGFLPHAKVSNMRLRKEGAGVGSAIELNCRTGERCRFEDLYIGGFRQSGTRLNKGGQPVVLRDIHVFQSDEYGVDLRRTGGDIWHMVSLDTISGDNHGFALIHIDTAGAAMESFSVVNVKAERLLEGTMRAVIELDNLNKAPVRIENLMFHAIKPLSFDASGPQGTVIRMNSGKVRIVGGLIQASNTAILIDDIPAGRQVPYDPNRLGFIYDSDVGMLGE